MGLKNEYKSDIEKTSLLFFGLHFYKPEEGEISFTDDLKSIWLNDNWIREFTDYVFDNYINSECGFSPKM